MADLVTDGKYPGGTCIEVAVAGCRTLGTWNILPPESSGTSVPEEVLALNYAPILEKLKKERGN